MRNPMGSEGSAGDGTATEQHLARLAARDRSRWKEPTRKLRGNAVNIAELLRGPQRALTPAEVEQATRRLLTVITQKGVAAVVPQRAAAARAPPFQISLARPARPSYDHPPAA